VAIHLTRLKLVGPALFLVAILIAGLAAIPYFGVARLDAESRERQETLVKRNIAIWIDDVEFALTAWTIWDESIAKLDNAFDLDWTDRNIGQSLIGTSRTRFVGILDRNDHLIYSKTADEVAERPFFRRGSQAIGDDARLLVDRVRAVEAKPRSAGIPAPIAFSKIEVFDSDTVLLTASLFQPDFRTTTPSGKHAPVLVSAIPIAGTLQEFLGNRFLLDGAMVGPLSEVSPDRARVEIAVAPGGQAEVLSWLPPTPALDLLYQTLPLAAVVTIVLVAGGVLAVRLSQRTLLSLVASERRMRHAATHDFLTGLANRSLLEPKFKRFGEIGDLAVVCVDLDGFKAVNDRHGHAAGDELLKQVASRLQAGCRANEVVYRLGGDEFAVLIPSVSRSEVELRCRGLSSSLAQPYQLGEACVSISASFGFTQASKAGSETCDEALRRADRALYQAKASGRGVVVESSCPHVQSAA
jgi:diguanylate cyclase (GGDEF)-like protein